MGQKLTMKEQMRRNHRAVKKAVREVEREHKALERNQKKLVTDIKKLAKQGQMNAVKIMAKDLVRNKRFCTKMLEMRSQVSSLLRQLTGWLGWSRGHVTHPLLLSSLSIVSSPVSLPGTMNHAVLSVFPLFSHLSTHLSTTNRDNISTAVGRAAAHG